MNESDSYCPPGFQSDETGVKTVDSSGAIVPITSTACRCIAFVHDIDGGRCSREIEITTRFGKKETIIIPESEFHASGGGGVIKRLADAGLGIIHGKGKALIEYLLACNPEKSVAITNQCGWLEGKMAYATPDRVIGDSGGEIIRYHPQEHSPTEDSMHPAGTLDQWKDNVASFASENLVLIFAMCVALAGPLLRFIGLASIAIHLYGLSSRGKTTAASVAASIHGNGGDPGNPSAITFARNWNITANALDGIANAHNDAAAIFDEIGRYSGNDFDRVVYNLTSGTGKAAMNSARALQACLRWTCSILSTGEISTSQKIQEGGKAVKGGHKTRFLDVYVSEIISDSHGLEPAAYADQIKHNCATYYGTAGPAFIERIIEQRQQSEDEFIATLRLLMDQFARELTPEAAKPEQARAIRQFAAIQVAGTLAVRWNILPFSEEEIRQAVAHACLLWQGGIKEVTDTDRGIKSLREFLLRHHTSLPTVNDKCKITNARGFKSTTRQLYLFTAEQLQSASGGCNPKDLCRELRDRKLIKITETGKLTVKEKIRAISDKQINMYGIKWEILDSFEEHDDPKAFPDAPPEQKSAQVPQLPLSETSETEGETVQGDRLKFLRRKVGGGSIPTRTSPPVCKVPPERRRKIGGGAVRPAGTAPIIAMDDLDGEDFLE